MTVKPLDVSVLKAFPAVDEKSLDRMLSGALAALGKKIVVLDDDPTGVQTVHGVPVYTSWNKDDIAGGLTGESGLFFILTNSRSFTAAKTAAVHREIAGNLLAAAAAAGKSYILISRSDSTLRGHYPLETQVLREEIERNTSTRFDGEIIFPFFQEGGRFTIGDIHYVRDGEKLIPAAMTEFAGDGAFGYTSSDLKEWCAEKSGGLIKAADVISISLEELRALDFDGIERKLLSAENFGKIVVNAIAYSDVKVFSIAFARAAQKGGTYIFRSAAAVPKTLGAIPDKPFLNKAALLSPGVENGGVVIIGSHVNKTSRQLEVLRNDKKDHSFIEFDQHLVSEEDALERETARVSAETERAVSAGITAVVYTRRERVELDTADSGTQLETAAKISAALTGVIANLTVRPSFILAKGGITASDTGVKALSVKKATVMGQIKPGIPVWKTDEESKFPNLPFIIFPGNVGDDCTLRDIVDMLTV